ncbi:receptor-like protein 2 [Pyrus ussuriensis x Pyrus communis]|uniref:Receptor-like protein 2 n=1 Tax=Pyrus ussuriensis x Pyrus communis TaxID=2448454 RepID=A0A5N5H5L6_9ROSA|nr:receptor-like protein 2 [Pyrus ussuriensis x Pyrus communis]
MTVGLTKAQEREACVDSFLPSPSQTTKYSWEFSRSVENNVIWVSKSDEILLDLWKPVVFNPLAMFSMLWQVFNTVGIHYPLVFSTP